MAAPDPDAWWSPVPGGPRTGAAEPHPVPYGVPYAPVDPGHGSTPASGPTPSGRRAGPRPRWPLVLTAGVLVLALGVVLTVRLVGGATKVLHDHARTLSVTVPRSWFDNTGEPGADPDVAPVLAASNLWQSQRIEVDRFDVDDGTTLASFHAEGVDGECARWPCSTRTGPQRLSVAGHEALEQVVTHAADADGGATTSLTLTVWLDDRAVEVYGLATAGGAEPPDARPLRRVAASLELS